MVVVSHLFFFFDKKFGEGVTRYESHPPSLRTVYFPTALFNYLGTFSKIHDKNTRQIQYSAFKKSSWIINKQPLNIFVMIPSLL